MNIKLSVVNYLDDLSEKKMNTILNKIMMALYNYLHMNNYIDFEIDYIIFMFWFLFIFIYIIIIWVFYILRKDIYLLIYIFKQILFLFIKKPRIISDDKYHS